MPSCSLSSSPQPVDAGDGAGHRVVVVHLVLPGIVNRVNHIVGDIAVTGRGGGRTHVFVDVLMRRGRLCQCGAACQSTPAAAQLRKSASGACRDEVERSLDASRLLMAGRTGVVAAPLVVSRRRLNLAIDCMAQAAFRAFVVDAVRIDGMAALAGLMTESGVATGDGSTATGNSFSGTG